MKLYTAEYDANRPSAKSVQVPLNSSFGVAVGVKNDGEDMQLKQNEVMLDGTLSATDVVDGKYLVFKLSSDGEAGYDKYDVGLNTSKSMPNIVSPDDWTNGTPLSGRLDKELWGKTFDCTPRVRESASDVDFPFLPVRVSDTGDISYAGTYGFIYSSDLTKPYAQISMNNNRKLYQLKVPNQDMTNWVSVDTFTVPEGAVWYCGGSTVGIGTTKKLYCHPAMQLNTNRKFDLYVKKADKGEIEGYGDEYVFKNTVSLSGTYEDDTEFSYTLPVTE